MKIQEVDPVDLKKMLDKGEALLIDVRERLEYNEEHIAKAQLYPCSGFDPLTLPEPFSKKIVFYCRSGKRSAHAGIKWAEYNGFSEAYSLKGGIEFWKAAALPTVVNLEVERKIEHQTYILAGSFVIIGCLLAYFFSDWFLVVPLLIGLLLTVSGFRGHCYISYLLSKLPYN